MRLSLLSLTEVPLLDPIWEFLISGGVFMGMILVCSLVAASVFFHRLISLRRGAVEPQRVIRVLEQAERYFKRGDYQGFAAQVGRGDSPLGRLAAVVVDPSHTRREEIESGLEARAKEEVLKLQSGLATFEVVITIAPLLGLLGTVSGLVSVFGVLGESTGGGADPAMLAAGIAKALNTTIAGLVVAVPTVISHSYFSKKIEAMGVSMELKISDLIGAYVRGRENPAGSAASGGFVPLPEGSGKDSPAEETEG